MNQKTPYELTITGKLQNLPLPDLEDAIWARVKAQLDLDLPTDDTDGEGPDAPSGGSGWIWSTGLFMVVAAIVAVFFLRKNTNPTQTIPTNTVQKTTPLAAPAQQTTGSPPALIQNDATPQTLAPTGASPGAVFQPPPDSFAVAPTTALPLLDSQQTTAAVTPPPAKADTSSLLPQKPKTRGVKGLTDDDYRIVPAKKDSL